MSVNTSTLEKCQSIVLGERIAVAIKQASARAYPNEACGVITKDGKGELIAIECQNIAIDSRRHFEIDAREYNLCCDTTGVFGIWHSHVDNLLPATPSRTDINGCNKTGVPWLIVDVCGEVDGSLSFGDFFCITPEEH